MATMVVSLNFVQAIHLTTMGQFQALFIILLKQVTTFHLTPCGFQGKLFNLNVDLLSIMELIIDQKKYLVIQCFVINF